MSNYTMNHSATKSHAAELAEGLASQSLGVPIGGVEVGGHSKNLHNPVSHHLADTHEAHVDVASAARAGGRVGDEAASLVVSVHFRWRFYLNELEEDVAHIRDTTHSFVEGDDLGLSSELCDELLSDADFPSPQELRSRRSRSQWWTSWCTGNHPSQSRSRR